MKLESKVIENIYSGKVAQKYDFSVPPLFARWKKKAFEESSLKAGDSVLVFCCGTGLDFTHILKRVGKQGKIVGVDFSSEMLKSAKEKIEKHRWDNVELIEADITKPIAGLKQKFDIGVCTLGLSIIPDYQSAYKNLLSLVKKQGQIIIGDMQLASGWQARLNPITISMAKKFGGTHDGHQNSLKLQELMSEELKQYRKREFFFGSYYYCMGKK